MGIRYVFEAGNEEAHEGANQTRLVFYTISYLEEEFLAYVVNLRALQSKPNVFEEQV